MRTSSVSREYARALFMLGQRTGRLDEIGAELDSLTDLVERRPPIRNFFLSPQLSAQTKVEVLKKALGGRVIPELLKFILVLTSKRREDQLAGIRASYNEELNRFHNRLDVQVETAVGLTENEIEQLRARLSRRLEQTVRLQAAVDPQLIGGLVCHIGDMVYDGSIRRQLQRLANLMLKARI